MSDQPNREQQSPINLTTPTYANFGKDGLEIKWKKSIFGKASTRDHGVIEFDSDDRQYVVLNRRKYHLAQFHFHHPSEHWVDGVQLTFELHVVHQNVDDGSRVVVGIFLEPTEKPVTAPVSAPWITQQFTGGEDCPVVPQTLNPMEWLPDNFKEYFRYEGSLTTEPYSENVSWAILKYPKFVPTETLKSLIRCLRHSPRFCQPLYRRYLLANWK